MFFLKCMWFPFTVISFSPTFNEASMLFCFFFADRFPDQKIKLSCGAATGAPGLAYLPHIYQGKLRWKHSGLSAQPEPSFKVGRFVYFYFPHNVYVNSKKLNPNPTRHGRLLIIHTALIALSNCSRQYTHELASADTQVTPGPPGGRGRTIMFICYCLLYS